MIIFGMSQQKKKKETHDLNKRNVIYDISMSLSILAENRNEDAVSISKKTSNRPCQLS
jgi:hypothetical protein